MIIEYNKITDGYVTQHFVLQSDGRYKCINQHFKASYEVEYISTDGDDTPVDIEVEKEQYHPFDMVQPSE